MSMSKQVDPNIAAKIDAIDLTNAKKRLMDPKSGRGWSQSKADDVERKYKNFLKLISTGMRVCPTLDIDEMWHTCILDTKTYAKTCKEVFGYFIHHDPYLSDQDLKAIWKNSCEIYQKSFGESYSSKTK